MRLWSVNGEPLIQCDTGMEKEHELLSVCFYDAGALDWSDSDTIISGHKGGRIMVTIPTAYLNR